MHTVCCVAEKDGAENVPLISYDEALEIIRHAATLCPLAVETIPLIEIPGRICAEDITAPLMIQPFDNSAMDGFAVRADDLVNACKDHPISLEVLEIVAAGAMPQKMIKPGQCTEIMTGAPMSEGADTVVPVELTQMTEGRVIFTAPTTKGKHLRKAGEDFQKGDPVLQKGMRLEVNHIMALATLGIDGVTVVKKTRAGFMATGREIVDDLSKPLNPGEIYNSNQPYAEAFLKECGVDCVISESVPDEPEEFERRLDKMMENNLDIIVSSGAVSAGKYDFIRSVLESKGAEILFHKVGMKPGKPNLFARLPDGTLYFGLPGNPAAVAVGLRFFVCPALRAMAGLAPEQPLRATLVNGFQKKKGLRFFLKAAVETSAQGGATVKLLSKQQSFQVSPFLQINAWAIASEEAEKLNVDDDVDVYPAVPVA